MSHFIHRQLRGTGLPICGKSEHGSGDPCHYPAGDLFKDAKPARTDFGQLALLLRASVSLWFKANL